MAGRVRVRPQWRQFGSRLGSRVGAWVGARVWPRPAAAAVSVTVSVAVVVGCLAGVTPRVSASGATPPGTEACVQELSCPMEMIVGWDVPTRASWFRNLRARLDAEVAPGAGAVFENIQDVLRLSQAKGFDRHSWFLVVDAGIIEGIQAGFALVDGRGSESSNWGAVRWQRFFEAYRGGRPPTELNRLWGEAEQAATNYGIDQARVAGHRLGNAGTDERIRFALIEVGNTYRQNLARSSTASKWVFWRVCNAPGTVVEFFTGLYLRVATTVCAGVEQFFSVLGPSVIMALGGVAYDTAPWLRPIARSMGLFDYRHDGLWADSVALP